MTWLEILIAIADWQAPSVRISRSMHYALSRAIFKGFQSIEERATSYLTDLQAFDPTGPYISGGFLLGES